MMSQAVSSLIPIVWLEQNYPGESGTRKVKWL